MTLNFGSGKTETMLVNLAVTKFLPNFTPEQAEVEADVQAKAKPAVAIRNPNFVDPGMETDNEYNKTHEMTRDEVSFNSKP